MAHWAEIDETNIVKRVVVMNNDQHEDEGYQWLIDNLGGTWIQTSYNTHANEHKYGGTPFRKNYAGIGYVWDGIGFREPQFYDSWILNQETYMWEPPIPAPTDGKPYRWDESTTSWIEVQP